MEGGRGGRRPASLVLLLSTVCVVHYHLTLKPVSHSVNGSYELKKLEKTEEEEGITFYVNRLGVEWRGRHFQQL